MLTHYSFSTRRHTCQQRDRDVRGDFVNLKIYQSSRGVYKGKICMCIGMNVRVSWVFASVMGLWKSNASEWQHEGAPFGERQRTCSNESVSRRPDRAHPDPDMPPPARPQPCNTTTATPPPRAVSLPVRAPRTHTNTQSPPAPGHPPVQVQCIRATQQHPQPSSISLGGGLHGQGHSRSTTWLTGAAAAGGGGVRLLRWSTEDAKTGSSRECVFFA